MPKVTDFPKRGDLPSADVPFTRGKLPVVEIFGPTIQGEGVDQGISCYFVRFGGCDFKCVWCDTPHAVLPHAVRQAKRMEVQEIIDALDSLAAGPEWVVLSGGNPALHALAPLVRELKKVGYKVAVETQGSREKEWFYDVDRLCVSPKPPSSKQKFEIKYLDKILYKADPDKVFMKIVVFDHNDYLFAKDLHLQYPDTKMFLSAGNDAGMTVENPDRIDPRTEEQIKLDLLTKVRWLANRVMVDQEMYEVQVQAQFHVLLWGNKQGV